MKQAFITSLPILDLYNHFLFYNLFFALCIYNIFKRKKELTYNYSHKPALLNIHLLSSIYITGVR